MFFAYLETFQGLCVALCSKVNFGPGLKSCPGNSRVS